MRTPKMQTARLPVSVRLAGPISLEAHGNGAIVAFVNGDPLSLGSFGSATASRLKDLRSGLSLISFESGGETGDKELDLLVRRLAARGLLEYCIGRANDPSAAIAVIEPQVLGYTPQTPELKDTDTLVLSRFAYMRRRGVELVLESPLSGALFRILDAKLASLIAMMSTPRQIRELRHIEGFPSVEFLELLVDCRFVFKVDKASEGNLRMAEGDHGLALWDFHDLLFHTQSTEGRHTNPLGAVYPHGGAISAPPAVRPSWPGEKIDLCSVLTSKTDPVAKLLRERHSERTFDDGKPITLSELSQFLDGAARIIPQQTGGDDAAKLPRPYASAGASWELELYLAVNICEGLPKGFYHYDAAAHALVPIDAPAADLKMVLQGGARSMGAESPPQVLLIITARFGRISWKYSAVAYQLVLKDLGVLTQTLYLMATGMGLGGCAIGLANIEQFARMTGVGFHVEGPVGQFALGRSRGLKASR